MPLGTSDGHIKQPAFFFEFARRVSSARTGEDIFLQTHDEDCGELQSLSRMHRHQGHSALVVALAVEVGEQGHLLQIVRERNAVGLSFLASRLDKLLQSAQKLLQILLPCKTLGIGVSEQVGLNTTLGNDAPPQFKGILGEQIGCKTIQFVAKGSQLGPCALVDGKRIKRRLRQDVPTTHTVLLGGNGDLFDRCGSDATCRIVDDAFKGLFIVVIDGQSEVGNDVFYLFPLIKAQSPINAIRDMLPPHFLFERSTLRVGAVENGKLVVVAPLLPLQTLDILAHHKSFLLIRVNRLEQELLAFIVPAKHIFAYLPLVVTYQTVGRLHDVLRRAVVLFEFEESSLGKLLLKVENIVDVGPAKAIDTLRIIAHDADSPMPFSEQRHDTLLHMVGVLIFIHQHIAKSGSVIGPHSLVVAQQLMGEHQQIVEVHGIGGTATLHIRAIDVMDFGQAIASIAL